MASVSVPAEALVTWVSANAGTIAAVSAAVGVAGSAYESHQQGVAAQNLDKQKALVAQQDEAQKQIGMRENMLKAMAAQNAGTLGAVGTGAGSGFGANAMRQITQSQNDLMVSKANSAAQVSLLDSAGNQSRAAGNIGAVTDLASGGYNLYKNS